MPRSVLPTRILPKLGPKNPQQTPKPNAGGPKLFNAKRQIPVSQSIYSRHGAEAGKIALADLKKDPFNTSWRRHVSEDVVQFVDDMEAQGTKLLPEEILSLVKNPSKYFSRPQNVPTTLRKQVYFPDFCVTLIRMEYMGPYYAKFRVPMWFNKLDMKGYLKELYNVDVVHIRSSVTPTSIERRQPSNPYSRGPVYRSKPGKTMIVQLVDPFTWPVRPRDVDRKPFAAAEFRQLLQAQQDDQEKQADIFKSRLDKKHRKSIAEQAKELLEGKAKWQPTWQQLPDALRMMTGSTSLPAEEQKAPQIQNKSKKPSPKPVDRGFNLD